MPNWNHVASAVINQGAAGNTLMSLLRGDNNQVRSVRTAADGELVDSTPVNLPPGNWQFVAAAVVYEGDIGENLVAFFRAGARFLRVRTAADSPVRLSQIYPASHADWSVVASGVVSEGAMGNSLVLLLKRGDSFMRLRSAVDGMPVPTAVKNL